MLQRSPIEGDCAGYRKGCCSAASRGKRAVPKYSKFAGKRGFIMERKSGILLPVSSLPSRYGIGCFSREAYEFVDYLVRAGQTYWQILPLGQTGYGDSPYQSFSTFAGNPYFIDPEKLIQLEYISREEADAASLHTGRDEAVPERRSRTEFPPSRSRRNRPPLARMPACRCRDKCGLCPNSGGTTDFFRPEQYLLRAFFHTIIREELIHHGTEILQPVKQAQRRLL